ncbi:MAG: hypothetical protein IKN11_07565 [Bacteroidales bacterium]|nr:hypothetical protein [Bacteroidales bacterium]
MTDLGLTKTQHVKELSQKLGMEMSKTDNSQFYASSLLSGCKNTKTNSCPNTKPPQPAHTHPDPIQPPHPQPHFFSRKPSQILTKQKKIRIFAPKIKQKGNSKKHNSF